MSALAGLTSAEAASRLVRYGQNTIVEHGAPGPVRLLGRQFSSPLVLILVAGALVSLVVREWLDAAIVLVIVLGSALLGVWQESRASRAVAALRERLALTARVLRDGVLRTVPARDIVPGDVVSLSAGNLIPADGHLLDAADFLVSEASLTGEPLPVLLSTAFDLLAFFVLLKVYAADRTLFQTAWFVLSLLTELAVILALRTEGPAWHSVPSRVLLSTTAAVGALAIVAPYGGPLASVFGFVPLPARILAAVLLILTAYLAAVEAAKRLFYA